MNFVYPITDPEVVKSVAQYLKANNKRDHVMFMSGILGAMRIGDILRLRVGDVKNRDYIYIREQKTGKVRNQKISPELKRVYKEFCEDMDSEDYLIHNSSDSLKPITRQRAYTILNEAAEHFGLEHIGTHTMRKTFGYHFYKQHKDIVTLQKILNHTHKTDTLKYIGIEQNHIDNAFNSFKIFD